MDTFADPNLLQSAVEAPLSAPTDPRPDALPPPWWSQPWAPRGRGNGNYKNGEWTAEAIEERRWLLSLVRDFAR